MARYARNYKNSTSLRHGHRSIKTKSGRSSFNKAKYARTKTHSYKKRGRKVKLFKAPRKTGSCNRVYVNNSNVTPEQIKQTEDTLFYVAIGFAFIFFVCLMSLMRC